MKWVSLAVSSAALCLALGSFGYTKLVLDPARNRLAYACGRLNTVLELQPNVPVPQDLRTTCAAFREAAQ